jgi:hypothetical protein
LVPKFKRNAIESKGSLLWKSDAISLKRGQALPRRFVRVVGRRHPVEHSAATAGPRCDTSRRS